MSLRSILGGSRVKKKKSSGSRSRASPSSSTSLSEWTSSLPHIKPGNSSGRRHGKALAHSDDVATDYFNDRLDDAGLVHTLATDTNLRDLPCAMRNVLDHMFEAVPLRSGAGFSSEKVATLLRFRDTVPPLVTSTQLHAMLPSGPTAVERESAELIRAGTLRRIVVPSRGALGELLVSVSAMEQRLSAAVDAQTSEAFLAWLRAHPAALTLTTGNGLSEKQVDLLARAGFLTAENGAAPGLNARPEDRFSAISLEAVSRAASGSLAAVGGRSALVSAGGSGAGGGRSFPGSQASMRITMPGTGAFLKLVSSAVSHLLELLRRSSYQQMPESELQERWDGGVAGDKTVKVRGDFTVILPSRTKKWKFFEGLAFHFVLREAAGAGLVELYDTKSVGRGVRLV